MNDKILSAVPFKVENHTEVTDSTESGFVRASQSLTIFGEYTAENMAEEGVYGVEAIPSSIAYLEKFRMEMNFGNQGDFFREKEWRAVLTAFILHEYRGLSVDFKEVKLSQLGGRACDIIGESTARLLGAKDVLYIMLINNTIAAIVDNSCLLIPCAQLPDLLFPFDYEALPGSLLDYERDFVFTYLDCIMENEPKSFLSYGQKYKSELKNLQAKRLPQERFKLDEEYEIIFSSFNSQDYQKRMDKFLTVPKLDIVMPEVFTEKLIIATIKRIPEECGYLTFVLEDNQNKECFMVLLPLTESITVKLNEVKISNDESELMDSSDTSSLELIDKKIDISHLKDRDNGFIQIRLCFKNGNQILWREKDYPFSNIQYITDFPFIYLYPYVSLPRGEWKRYYSGIYHQTHIDIPVEDWIKNCGAEKLEGKNIDLLKDSFQQKSRKESMEWKVAVYNELPRFLELCLDISDSHTDMERNKLKKSNFLGVIQIERPAVVETQNFALNRTFQAAIDFGTRNSVIAVKENGENQPIDHKISRGSYFKIITQAMNVMVENDFPQDYYSPMEDVEGKIATVGQVYANLDNVVNLYIHGNAVVMSSELMSRLKDDLNNPEGVGIYTNLKFGASDNIRNKALDIYLQNLVFFAVLQAKMKGAKKINFSISYPREEIKKKVINYWKVAFKQAEEYANVSISSSFITEAEANFKYLRKTQGKLAPNELSSFGTVDIGDGTTDSNLFVKKEFSDENVKQVQASIRYAGNDIVVKTITDYFNHSAERINAFRGLWDIPSIDKISSDKEQKKKEFAEALIDQYCMTCVWLEENSKPMIREAIRIFILSLIEQVGFSPDLHGRVDNRHFLNFVEFLKMKYVNLFRLYTVQLKKFNVLGNSDQGFRLYVYGGGRHGLRLITNDSLLNFDNTPFGKVIQNLFIDTNSNCSSGNVGPNIVSDDNEKKQEVVDGLVDETILGIKTEVFNDKESVDDLYMEFNQENVEERKVIFDNSVRERLTSKFQEYIKIFKSPNDFIIEDAKGNRKSIYLYLEVKGDKTQKTDNRIQDNMAYFQHSMTNLWQEVLNDTGCPAFMQDEFFCIKMVEELVQNHLKTDDSI